MNCFLGSLLQICLSQSGSSDLEPFPEDQGCWEGTHSGDREVTELCQQPLDGATGPGTSSSRSAAPRAAPGLSFRAHPDAGHPPRSGTCPGRINDISPVWFLLSITQGIAGADGARLWSLSSSPWASSGTGTAPSHGMCIPQPGGSSTLHPLLWGCLSLQQLSFSSFSSFCSSLISSLPNSRRCWQKPHFVLQEEQRAQPQLL